MHPSLRRSLALALAEATHTGNPLVAMPADAVPRGIAEGCRIATLTLEALDLTPCGLRLAPAPGGGMVAGPMLQSRMLPQNTAIALAMLRHPLVSPAVLGLLAADLPRRGDQAPSFVSLHPALDIAGWRLDEPPSNAALAVADLAGLGFLVVAGRGKTREPMPSRMSFGPAGIRRHGQSIDLRPALAAAAEAAQRAGGLPRGAALVAVIGPGTIPVAGANVSVSFAGLGTARARLV